MFFWALLLLAIPFGLPLYSLIAQSLIRARMTRLEETLEAQNDAIEALERRLRLLSEPKKESPVEVVRPPVAAPVIPPPAPIVTPPVVARPEPPPPPVLVPPPPVLPPPPPRVPRPPLPPITPPPAPQVPFDWENLVGVKLFSGIAGIALVLAAVFFLKYSMDHGWLAPPVRVAIGIIVAIALLVMCELKAARRYPVTANALDAAAIAILFATFFAAHALWHLIPAAAAFVLLALVTGVAVLLSIRRDSLFIAVLGLLGGFCDSGAAVHRREPADPALRLPASAERRPGVGRVERKKLAGTHDPHAGADGDLPVGLGHQVPLRQPAAAGDGHLPDLRESLRSRRSMLARGDSAMDVALERTGLGASAMPLVFAVYLAAVPAYGARAGLLFGFLLLARRRAAGGVAGARRRRPPAARDRRRRDAARVRDLARRVVLAAARGSRSRCSRPPAAPSTRWPRWPAILPAVRCTGAGAKAVYASPILLFVFPVIARIEPAAAAPLMLFGAMFALLALIAWRALATRESGLYFIAAFFAVAAEASWSATFLTPDRLRAAIVLYAAFGAFYLGVPLISRRLGRGLEPCMGRRRGPDRQPGPAAVPGRGRRARPRRLWGLALLLAILDAGLFIESSAGDLPWLAAVGAVLSWVVLGVWWNQAAAVVGLLPSLLVADRADADHARRTCLGAHPAPAADRRGRRDHHRRIPPRHLPGARRSPVSFLSSPRIRAGPRRRGRCLVRWPC